jgi:putative drug exporter of the RND superfamily
MAAGLLLDTFVIRGMLVPAIARLLGDRNWWPGRIHAPASAPPEPRSHESPIPAATNG